MWRVLSALRESGVPKDPPPQVLFLDPTGLPCLGGFRSEPWAPRRACAPARSVLTWRTDLPGVDAGLSRLYARGVHRLFTNQEPHIGDLSSRLD